VGGELDVGGRAAGAALRDHIAGAAFALAALGGYAEFELDLVKAEACTRMAGNFAVRDSAADANDHGLAWLLMDSIGEAIINANLSHLQSSIQFICRRKDSDGACKRPYFPFALKFYCQNTR
jgi:hypothetical protein